MTAPRVSSDDADSSEPAKGHPVLSVMRTDDPAVPCREPTGSCVGNGVRGRGWRRDGEGSRQPPAKDAASVRLFLFPFFFCRRFA